MTEDIKHIKEGSKIFVFVNKSRNIYKMERETYEKFFHKNITKTYMKTDKKTKRTIKREDKKNCEGFRT